MSICLLEEQVGNLLRTRGMKLTLAESCTGGLVGHRITNIPGSSDYYLGSITAYAYEVKENLLGVKHETLQNHGAVSKQTVIEMARGVRQALSGGFPLSSILGVSISGIAGPGGGLPEKPVGTVWIGMSSPEGDWAWRFLWKGDRIKNKEDSAQAALQLIIYYLQEKLPGEDWCIWDGSKKG
ncbi:MAG: CinA family protein [Chloroflexi bacterium]|nr:CinA family protein [Chloroflexota bacterium]